jgi:hypothetical protein
VVIGIILGMAVKGKALVDAARMRAEVAKINKFEAAAYIFYADTNNLPDNESGQPYILASTFVNKELLTNGDFDEKISGQGWAFYRCSPDNATPSEFFEPAGSGGNVCVTGNAAANVEDGTVNTTLTDIEVPTRLVCNIEIMKDDENTTNGEGRGWTTAIAETETTQANYRNCDNYTTGESVNYAFRVF